MGQAAAHSILAVGEFHVGRGLARLQSMGVIKGGTVTE